MTKVKKEITVQAPVDLVYGAWHNFENLPRFMENLQEVRVVADGRSHWKTRGPLGSTAEWDAEITMEEPNKAIGWRSIDGVSTLKTAGRVNFEPLSDATHLDVTIEYEAPAGPLGELVAKIFADPEQQVEQDLLRFKEAIERGADASGFTYVTNAPLGSSMGATTLDDLDEIKHESGDSGS
jgi:uncharacterized membrane protein